MTVRGLALAGLFFHVGCDGWHGGRLTRPPADKSEPDESPGDEPAEEEPALTAEIAVDPTPVRSGDTVSFEGRCTARTPRHSWTLDGMAQSTSDSVFKVRLVIPGNHIVGYSCTDATGQLASAADLNVLVSAGLTLAYQTALDQPGGSELYAVPMVDPSQRYKLSPALPAAGAKVREVGYSPDDRWLYHLSDVGGGRLELSFRLRSGGASYVVSAGLQGEVSPPRFSADGRYAAFVVGQPTTLEPSEPSGAVQLVDLSLVPPSVTKAADGSLASAGSWSSDAGALVIGSASGLRVFWPATPSRDALVPFRAAGVLNKALLSPDGKHVAIILEQDQTRHLYGAATDGTDPVELVCPQGPISELSLVTNDGVLVLCSDGSTPGVAALSNWDSSNWLALSRGLVPDARCGELQILTDGGGLYALSLANPQWNALRLISGPVQAGVTYAKGSAFARDCSSLFYLSQSGAQAFRVRFDESLNSAPAESVTLPVPASSWQNARLWPSPQGGGLLLSSKSALASAWWQGTPQVLRAEPNLVVQAGAGWLDEQTTVLQGGSSLTASSSLLKLVYQDNTLSQSAVLDEQLGNSDSAESAPRFAFSADGKSLLLIAGSSPRTAEALQALGSGEIPLQVSLAAKTSFEALIDKAAIALGKVQQVLPLGERALAFTAAVDEQWESVLYVHDMTSGYRVSPMGKVARQLSALASSTDGTAAAFSQADSSELLRAPRTLAMSASKAVTPATTFAAGGMFTGDGQWFLARPIDSASSLLAANVDTGAVRPLGNPAPDETQPFAVSARGGGVAFVAAIGPGARGLYFVDLSIADAQPRLLGPLPALADAPLAVWFSDDGSQLAYLSPTADGTMHELWMWKVLGDQPAQLRRSFASAAPGPRHRGPEASTLRAMRGLLFYPASQDNLAHREAWVLPWLDQEAEPWRVPSSAPIRACHQLADQAELVVESAAGPIERIEHYKIGSPHAVATLFEDTTSYDSVTSLQLSPTGTHFAFQMLLRHATYLARVNAAAQALEITPPRPQVSAPRFSPDGQFLLLETSDADSVKQLYFLPVERPTERTELDTKGSAITAAYWVNPPAP